MNVATIVINIAISHCKCAEFRMNNNVCCFMPAQLTPLSMQRLYSKYLSLADAKCLFDLFANQSIRSQWLDSRTVSCWMFRTNNPSDFQLRRTMSLLHKLSSAANGAASQPALLDMQIQLIDSGHGSMLVKPAYKLSSAVDDVILI